MKSKDDLNKTIFLLTQRIHKEFPELIKYLDEIPEKFESDTQKGVNNKNLKDYLDSLKDLLKTYTKNHEKL
tara:strand:- start:130 stop:342 length:213 start_codon:yes stop_codon:yes gene_type:complete